jgi:Flp pilus assembly pilin Flp
MAGKLSITATLRRWWREEDGPTTTEYAVLFALILLVAFTGIATLGTKVGARFNDCASASW